MATLAHIAGNVTIDGVASAREILVIKDDPNGRQVIAQGVSAIDGTFDISFSDWGGAVIAVAIDKYGAGFTSLADLSVDDIIHPTTPNGYVYIVTVAGTTAESEPDWEVDGSVQSGSVTLTPRPYYRPIASGPIQSDIISNVDPYFSDVVALQNFMTSKTDVTGRAWSDFGTPTISTGKLLIDAGSDSIFTASSSDFNWSAVSYTIEAYITPSQYGGDGVGRSFFMGKGVYNPGTLWWWFGPRVDGKLVFGYWGGAIVNVTGTLTIPLSVETHIAMTHEAGVIRLFVNGVLDAVFTIATAPSATSAEPIRIGLMGTSGFNGATRGVRFTKGVARYDSDFTPPVLPLPDSD
jgi:hypothetical protein